jgi:hypothetical protein
MPWIVAALFACGAPEAPEAPVAAAPAVEAPAAEAQAEPAAAVVAPGADGWSQFGAAPTLAAAEPATALLSNAAARAGQTVRVAGTVSSVCQKAGCWMVLADDAGHQLRVTMKDHAFALPKDCNGQAADIEGQLVQKAVDPKTVEHFKSESDGGPVPEEGKAEVFEIVASGVRLKAS